MAKFVYYACPDCGGKFKHLHVLSDEPPPDRCPLCHSWMSDAAPPAETFVPLAPGIKKSPYTKSVDQTYRAMESASIDRAREAADMAGVSEAEMSHLKITNQRDPSEMREGDVSAILPPSSVAAQRLTNGPSAPGFQQFGGAVPNYAPGIGPGNAGASAHAQLNGHQGWVDGSPPTQNAAHQARAAQMIRAGSMGSYKE